MVFIVWRKLFERKQRCVTNAQNVCFAFALFLKRFFVCNAFKKQPPYTECLIFRLLFPTKTKQANQCIQWVCTYPKIVVPFSDMYIHSRDITNFFHTSPLD